MKKIINDGSTAVSEMLEGVLAAYPRHYELVGENALAYRNRRKKGVAIVTGGGSGHEPTFSGFVGKGLADAVACGNVFTSPNPQIAYDAAKAVNTGDGILFLYGNYAGDNMNFDIAEEMLADEGIATAHVRGWDDCASAPRDRVDDRRGIAGNLFLYKIAGAACDTGKSLQEVVRIVEKARDSITSIGLATSPATIPGVDAPPFTLEENEIEYGMGIHGEPGIERTVMQPADALADRLYAEIKRDMDLKRGEEVCALVNGMGSTTLLELFIVYRRLAQLLEQDGVKVYDSEVGTYCTCQEMGGFSVSILRLDDELKGHYDAPCYSPFYAKEARK